MKKLLCAILCLALMLPWSGTAAEEIFCTVLNDKLQDITKSTMPVRYGGQIYMPYSVFESGLGITAARNASINSLVLYNFDYTLTYDIAKGTAFDEQLNSYSSPALSHNGTIYVSLQQVCAKFGLSFAIIPSLATVVRVNRKTPSLSDKAFLKVALPLIDNLIKTYKNSQNQIIQPELPTPNPDPEPEPTNPDVPEPVKKRPSRLYLNFDGALNANTTQILDVLNDYNLPAAFFVSPEEIIKNDDMVREIVARGHRIGILLETADHAVFEKACEDLDFVVGTKTRLVKIKDQGETVGFDDALLWSSNYAPNEAWSSSRIVTGVRGYLESTRSQTTITFSSTTAVASAMGRVASYITAERIYTSLIYDSDTPRI